MIRFINRNMSELSVLCILLVFQLDITRVAAQTPPEEFLIQIERSAVGEDAGIVRNLKEGDQIFAFLDVAWPLFPLRVTKMQVLWQRPPGSSTFEPIKVIPLLYEATPSGGVLRYESDIAVLQPDGLNEILFTRTYWEDPEPPIYSGEHRRRSAFPSYRDRPASTQACITRGQWAAR